jgi:hypothetical protein
VAPKDNDTVYLDHVVWRLKPGLKSLSKKDISYYKKKHNASKVLIINERGELVYYDN